MLYQPLNTITLAMPTLLMPAGFDTADDETKCPTTYRALLREWQTRGRITVWTGASENTIFGDPAVNWSFRAWHDYCHAVGRHDFSLAGETATAYMQIAQMYARFGQSDAVEKAAWLIKAEVIGQREHYERTGKYVTDQVAFARDWLLRRGIDVA